MKDQRRRERGRKERQIEREARATLSLILQLGYDADDATAAAIVTEICRSIVRIEEQLFPVAAAVTTSYSFVQRGPDLSKGHKTAPSAL